jgi:hypothetical protein
MSIPSNLYAQKIFGEHPLAIWPLDDQIDYTSIITGNKGDIDASWTITNGTATSSLIAGPITTSPTSSIIGNAIPGTGPQTTRLEVLLGVSFTELEQSIKTFGMSLWFKPQTDKINNIKIGYVYLNPSTSLDVQELHSVDVVIHDTWQLISSTFVFPQVNAPIRLVIEVTYTKNGSATYPFSINGVSAGQRFEEFSAISTGVLPENLPASIPLPSSIKQVETGSYGLNTYTAYHLSKNNALRSRNFGVPLVYGSNSSTTLINNGLYPSLIVPGLGFLNDHGKYRELTLESWIRINSGTSYPVRIIGPISSTDGLYVNGSFLTLKINDHVGSHPVSEWGRPMLVDIKISNNSASLLVNGEQVILLNTKTDSLVFPEKTDANGKDQDWIGFYSDDNIGPVSIDCVAIYPYAVPDVVAKRRFVYGQGVEFPENINSSYSSTAVVADYSFANYANNYNYPENAKWDTGISENLTFQNNILSVPEYTLPTLTFKTRTQDEWYLDVTAEELASVMMRPTEDWAEVDGYMLFPSLNAIVSKVKAFYGIFEKIDTQTTKQVLLKIINKVDNNYLEVSLVGTSLQYALSISNNLTVLKTDTVVKDQKFAVGFDIEALIKNYDKALASFFGNRDSLSIYVAGTKEFNNTFSGKVHSISFASVNDFSNIQASFDETGIAEFSSALDAFVPSYKLVMQESITGYRLDIKTRSYWEDYIPLSYFSKYVKDSSNNKYYALDLLQFNVGFPEPSSFVYDESIDDTVFDTSGSLVRTYITFQSLDSKATQPLLDFETVIPASSSSLVEPGRYIMSYSPSGDPVYEDWTTTRYEIVNNSVIFPPPGADINKLGVCIQVEVLTNGVLYNPVKIKNLQFASMALNDISSTKIGTRFGVPVTPFTRLGVYEDYKRRNPFTTYKGSTPYLHLTNSSGFKLVGKEKRALTRGLTMPVNQGLSSTYKVGAFQTFIKYSNVEFPENAQELFEIQSNSAHIKFYLVATDEFKKRGRIYGLNTATGAIEDGMVFYINGVLSNKAIINLNEWAILGIQFGTKLDFGDYQNAPATRGAFRITGYALMNNISHYQYTAEQESQAIKARPWSQVFYDSSAAAQPWSYWEESFIWKDVLYLLTTEKGNINPEEIFKAYTGTNKIIFADNEVLTLSEYPHRIYKDISWKSITQSAV